MDVGTGCGQLHEPERRGHGQVTIIFIAKREAHVDMMASHPVPTSGRAQ